MVDADQIFIDLKKITSKLLKAPIEKIEPIAKYDSKLKDDLGIDSVESLDFLHELEAFYSIEITDEDAAKLIRVSDVIDLIVNKRSHAR